SIGLKRVARFRNIRRTPDIGQGQDAKPVSHHRLYLLQLMQIIRCKYEFHHTNNVFMVTQNARFFSASANISSNEWVLNTSTGPQGSSDNDVPSATSTFGLKKANSSALSGTVGKAAIFNTATSSVDNFNAANVFENASNAAADIHLCCVSCVKNKKLRLFPP